MWQVYLSTNNIHSIYFNAWETDFNDDVLVTLIGEIELHLNNFELDPKKKKVEPYKNKKELNLILKNHRNKLYTFLGQVDKEDKIVCDWISIKIVRLSQKGNLLAKDEAINLLENLVNQWIEYDKSLFSWKGYNELITEHIEACIRRFRYAGSFIGYLYRTLEYSGRGLIPIEKFSLDESSNITGKRKIETFPIVKKN